MDKKVLKEACFNNLNIISSESLIKHLNKEKEQKSRFFRLEKVSLLITDKFAIYVTFVFGPKISSINTKLCQYFFFRGALVFC